MIRQYLTASNGTRSGSGCAALMLVLFIAADLVLSVLPPFRDAVADLPTAGPEFLWLGVLQSSFVFLP